MTKRYTLCGNLSGSAFTNLPVMIKDNVTGKCYERPEYWPHEAQEVADWLNGQDQPLVKSHNGD